MEALYIVAISIGGVFVLLLFIYLIRLYNAHQKHKDDKREMQLAYSERNLKKIEYDLAFYTGTENQIAKESDLSDDEKEELLRINEQALYAKPNTDTQKPLEGHFKA